VERLKKSGADVVLTEYPGAYHAYDSYTLTKMVSYPQAQTTRHCTFREGDAGEIVNTSSGKKFDYNDPCVERGTHIVYNAAAHEATLRAVKELLTPRLRTPGVHAGEGRGGRVGEGRRIRGRR
jgi:hypothetical protein